MRFGVVLAFVLCACGAMCPKGVQLTAVDGGVLHCVQATDCPRLSNVLVCGSYDDRLRDCVACESTLCLRYQAAACTP